MSRGVRGFSDPFLVKQMELLLVNERKGEKLPPVFALLVHEYHRNLVVFVGGEIIGLRVGVAAGGVLGAHHAAVQPDAALHLLRCSENAEALGDGLLGGVGDHRIAFDVSGSHEAGGRGQVAGETDGSHAAAFGREGKALGKGGFSIPR